LPSHSLKEYLERYRNEYPNNVLVFDEVDVNYEPTAYYRALEDRNPVIWFKKVRSFDDYELVTNMLGSYERMAFAIGCSVDQLYEKWNEIVSYSGEVNIRESKAPVKEQVAFGDDVDLSNIPAPKHFISDGSNAGFGNYVSSGLVVARDPGDHSIVNMSFARMQIIGKRKYAFDTGSRGHFSTYIEKAKKLGVSLPVSVVIGAHPLYYMLGASFVENEYSKAARVLDSDYVYGEINDDIPVPADSEVVIESEVALNEHFDEGPFTEFTGYTVSGSTGNVAYVKSILRKRKPIYYDICPANSNEHVGLFTMPRNAAITRVIKEFMPPGIEYSIEWPNGAAHFLALCSINKLVSGLAKQVGLALLGLDPLFSRIVIVNEGETELDLEKLLVNLAAEGAKDRVNVDIISQVYFIRLDQTLMPRETVGKMIIVTKNGIDNQPSRYSKTVENRHRVRLEVEGSPSSDVVFSHERVYDAKVNVIFDEDIDLTNRAQLVWAFGTRVVPDRDVLFSEDKGNVTIWASKKQLKIPAIPETVTNRVASLLQKSMGT
jgi:2,5-furandicarboxylate decarboxylase 1